VSSVGHDVAVLLSDDDPIPFEVQNRAGGSPFVIICDHAGQLLPRSLGSLGLTDEQRASHVAWDIGAAGVARRLAAALDGCLISQRYSRLVIDCNRPLTAVDSIATRSERTLIPGNRDLGAGAAEARALEVFEPYHAQIRGLLDERERDGRPVILVAMHSFTPRFLDVPRPWHVGVLYNRDARLAAPLLEALRDEGDLVVGDNEPYAVSDVSDFSIVHHGERRGIPHVELEIRQDLIVDDAGQDGWAARLARLLGATKESLFRVTQEAREEAR
jgi:predicted N-formylglutamate amidohydrolase